MTTILGVDPGFGRCGFAILEKTKKAEILKAFGTMKSLPRKNFPERLIEIAEDFQEILEKYKPDIVSIEDLFFVNNVTTGIQVAEVRGVLIFLAKKFGAQICEPKPVEIKKTFCGNGKAKKTEIQKMVKLYFNLEESPKCDDAADAIAIAFFATRGFDFLGKV
jgi:crossover junction endodeoxyribonuclease RuvC